MTFSIIIPAYNAEAFLAECLDSIAPQRGDDCEVIVVDDGSTDRTAAILAERPWLTVVSQSNRGMSAARNRGLQQAQGDYILFVDADDRLRPDALATLRPNLRGDDIICFGAEQLDMQTAKANDCRRPHFEGTMDGHEYMQRELLRPAAIHFVCIWQRAYRRLFLAEHGLCFNTGLRHAEDDLFTLQAMHYAQHVVQLDAVLYTYRVHPGGISRRPDPDHWRQAVLAQRQLVRFFVGEGHLHDGDTSLCRVLASNYLEWFTADATHDSQLYPLVDWKALRRLCVTPRHRLLATLLRLHPALLRLYLRMASLIRPRRNRMSDNAL